MGVKALLADPTSYVSKDLKHWDATVWVGGGFEDGWPLDSTPKACHHLLPSFHQGVVFDTLGVSEVL